MSAKKVSKRAGSAKRGSVKSTTGGPGVKKTGQRPRRHILVVDDEIMFTNLCVRTLTKVGFEVTAMNDPVKALERFQSNPLEFDIVIVDKIMPDLDGYELAEKMVQIRSGIPVIVASGYREELEKTRQTSTIIKGYAKKPISVSDLVTMIDLILEEEQRV